MTPKIGYKGPQLPPLPTSPKTNIKPMSGNAATMYSHLMNANAQKNQAMQQQLQQKKNEQKATGFTPQFSPEVKKGIQSIIDPTGANVGRQAVPMRRSPMMKKGGTTKLHSITKSNKKSNW